MRRMTYLVMALALVLGFTQCKKEQPVPQNENQAEGVRITLNLGDDNSKVVVTPGFYNSETGETYAKVEFEAGDVIYVGNNGAYCGYLEYNGSTNKFEGEVTPTSEDDYLHFYFMGNKGAKSQPSSVSITDQTAEYPVISYAHSTVKYASGTTSYSAKLQNYCAIVKFTTNDIPTATAVTVKGMQNTVSVDFGKNNAAESKLGINPYTPGQSGDGDIILHAESNTERWAILLQQDEVTNATASATGYTFKTFTVPAIENNQYLTNSGAGYSITVKSVTWDEDDIADIDLYFDVDTYTKGGISAVITGQSFWYSGSVYEEQGEVCFSSSIGNITRIEMTGFGLENGSLAEGWSISDDGTFIWSGAPNSTVPLLVGEGYWDDELQDFVWGEPTTLYYGNNASITFTVE